MVLLFSTCVDRFNPDLSDIASENELVVEGFITDTDESQKITLSRTVAVGLEDFVNPPESNAIVQVIDQDGNRHTLIEKQSGEYITNPFEFRAQVGNSYQLRIELADGEIYESDFQELLPVDPIDSVWWERSFVEEVNGRFVRDIEVVRFYTNYDEHDQTNYYRYEHFGTYAFASERQGQTICWTNPDSIPVDLSPNVICYLDTLGDLPLNISAYPDPIEGATGSEEIFNIRFGIRFRLGYSIEVRKYNLTKEYFDFLSAVREQGEFGGSIFDSPPTQILGNIRNVNNPSRFALGYFSTLAQTTKRVQIPALGFQRIPGRCDFDPANFIPPGRDCCDCRERDSAYVERPSFWVD